MEALATYDSRRMCKVLSMKKSFEIDLSEASLNEVIDEWQKFKERRNPMAGRNLFTLRRYLRAVEDMWGMCLQPWQITDLFYNEFVEYLYACRLKGSTINYMIAQLASILGWSTKHGCRVSSTYGDYRKEKYARTKISLTPDEVSQIYHFDVSNIDARSQRRRRLEKARDMFVLSCNLGQRYSDMIRLSPECFERNIFRITQRKTQNRARVDIDRLAIDKHTVYEILEKYGYQPPCCGDLTNYDKDIKALLQYIGGRFCEDIRIDTKLNGVMVTSLVPKWKMIASHTARRTFATINVIRGITEAEIRRGTGHMDGKNFERYICFDED